MRRHLTPCMRALRLLAVMAAVPFVVNAQSPEYERTVSWKRMVPNLVEDQKIIWVFPAHLVNGRHLLPTFAMLGATAAIVAADPPIARHFRKTDSFHDFNRVFGNSATTGIIVGTPAVFYLTGLFTHDEWTKNTGLLAAEAVASVEVPNLFLRNTIRRKRPSDIPPDGNFSNTWFQSGGNPFRAQGSFPSGHMASAMAVATVISRRYPRQRWVPFVAYGIAGAIGFSRITRNTHFTSDVFFGGALGYSVARFVVLRQ
jgi:membrane-associated phospholipid phosphatase